MPSRVTTGMRRLTHLTDRQKDALRQLVRPGAVAHTYSDGAMIEFDTSASLELVPVARQTLQALERLGLVDATARANGLLSYTITRLGRGVEESLR